MRLISAGLCGASLASNNEIKTPSLCTIDGEGLEDSTPFQTFPGSVVQRGEGEGQDDWGKPAQT